MRILDFIMSTYIIAPVFHDKPKKIIVTSNTSWYLYNFRLPLLKELVSRGYQVFALAPYDSYVKKLEEHGINHIKIRITRSSLNPFADLKILKHFVAIYRKYKPDIVQHFTVKPVIYGTLAARILHIKYIYNMVPGMGYVFTGVSFKKFWIQRIVRYLYRRSMKYSSHVFFQNRDDNNYFLKYKLVNKNRATIIAGTGVDIDKFKPGKKIEKKRITFMIAARLLWDKGIGEFAKAARALKQKYNNADFWLLGPVDLENPKGIQPAQLQQWNREGIVQYLGMTDNIKSYLKKADIIVLPSYYKEGLPLSLLEGAAMGMPIITTDSTGCREVVEDGVNGFLVPIKDVKSLAASMEKFIKKPFLISQMGRASRKIVLEKFDSKIIVKQILQYYPI